MDVFQSLFPIAAFDTGDHSHFLTLSVLGFCIIMFFQLSPYFFLRPFIIQFLHGFLFLCQLLKVIVTPVSTISLYTHYIYFTESREIVTKWNSIHVTICRFTSTLLLRSNQRSLHYDIHHFYTVIHPATYSTII